jgi:hypothetical protein
MQNFRHGIITLLLMACCVATPAAAQVSIGIGLPNVSIGINLPLYPELVPVPGYPVYYAPRVDANYFFYDGMYWIYSDDYWYASDWYNGPWSIVDPAYVPLYILRIPVRYYQQPPLYFRGWQRDASPRWGEHWGRGWEQQRRGWDRWNRNRVPARAPLPTYQREYSGERYPRGDQQHLLHRESYRYQPRERAARQLYQQRERVAPAPERRERQEGPQMRGPAQQVPQESQRQAPRYEQRQEPRREQQQEPRSQEMERRQEPRGGQGHEQRRDEGRGRGRD